MNHQVACDRPGLLPNSVLTLTRCPWNQYQPSAHCLSWIGRRGSIKSKTRPAMNQIQARGAAAAPNSAMAAAGERAAVVARRVSGNAPAAQRKRRWTVAAGKGHLKPVFFIVAP